MIEKHTEPSGSMTLFSRKLLTVDGVIDVLTFDEATVSLSTALGLLVVEGEELHVKKMDMESGVVALEGRVNGVYYQDDRPTHRKGLFGRRK